MALDRRIVAGLIVLALVAGGCHAADEPSSPAKSAVGTAQDRRLLGLFTTLPIYWGEAADMSETLSGAAKPGWVRGALEKRFALEPLDTLDAADLGKLRQLVLAQPRALSGPENVALDDWVRAGGRLLLFADPMLTAPSRFPIGDRRRPQDVVLLSPILGHWGLTLSYDEDAAEGEGEVAWSDTSLPVNLPGHLRAKSGSGCRIEAETVAECRIGKGRVTIVADAAVLEESDDLAPRQSALASLISRAFD